eukprot:CAMPEP_0194360190 /NCGR_PEP_ID=MMETSP0174-20130528/7483_1 /TAXON_ID=216777 /ORGANISM="Proboscia alata, Strain PI-D3" /LENGTH=666 /DNA_ID=CAMNT_0039131531 /DNA_START=1123 /DNA_END=3123 /DNA_ORIENTATION=-
MIRCFSSVGVRSRSAFILGRPSTQTANQYLQQICKQVPFCATRSASGTSLFWSANDEQIKPEQAKPSPATKTFSSQAPVPRNEIPTPSTSATPNYNQTGFFASNIDYPEGFASLGKISPLLLDRLKQTLGDSNPQPSAVQALAYPLLSSTSTRDMVIGAETGCGKTLAYLLPLMDDILTQKQTLAESGEGKLSYEYCRAIILVPNKELANQVLRMAKPLAGGEEAVLWDPSAMPSWEYVEGETPVIAEEKEKVDPSTIVRLGILPGQLESPRDYKPFRDGIDTPQRTPPLDLVIGTPASLGLMGRSPKNLDFFADVQTLVIDEADMLLDGGYIRILEDALMGFKRADRLLPKQLQQPYFTNKLGERSEWFDEVDETAGSDLGVKKTQHVFVGATIPNAGLKSVDAYIARKFPFAIECKLPGLHNARHYGLEESPTQWIATEGNTERLDSLVEMLRGEGSEGGGLKGEKTMVFLNSAKDVDGATNALRRAGINAVPYHAKISLDERMENLTLFRKFNVADGVSTTDNDQSSSAAQPVLVCTDLASRGLDIPGVTAIVQLQFATNVVIHLHRMGRCGRAGKKDGRGIIFYSSKEAGLVDVVREAENQQERMVLEGDVDDTDDKNSDTENVGNAGKVKNAFSRRRGFNKKRKKIRRKEMEATEGVENTM